MQSTTDNWRDQIANDGNFDQKVTYDVEKLVADLEIVVKNLNNIRPFEFLQAIYEFTKAFSILSSSLAMGFSDITTKVNICRSLFKLYPDCNDMQALMEKEIELKVHDLNTENNSKKGFKKPSPYANYESGTRTMLRLTWFLHFLHLTFRAMANTNEQFNTIVKQAYNDALGPHHTWFVRNAAKIGFGFAPSKKEPALKAFFGNLFY